jgi:hypothetical protein
MKYICTVITSACIVCILLSGCATSPAPERGGGLAQRFLSVADKHLLDFEGNRVPIESTCVIWIGRKTGMQPVEPYTCIHYWFPNHDSKSFQEAAIVVDDKEYESVMRLERQLKTLTGQVVDSKAFPQCKIRFVRYREVSALGGRAGTSSLRPAPTDTVCVIERETKKTPNKPDAGDA